MEKKTKVIVALVVMAVTIGTVIYFYNKKKKEDAALRMVGTGSQKGITKERLATKKVVKPKMEASAIKKAAEEIGTQS